MPAEGHALEAEPAVLAADAVLVDQERAEEGPEARQEEREIRQPGIAYLDHLA